MPIEVAVSGRTDVRHLFRKSGIRESEKPKHTPLLVFQSGEGVVQVVTLERADGLLAYPDDS